MVVRAASVDGSPVVGSRGGVAHQWMEGERPSWPRWCCRALPVALVVGQNGPWVDCFPCHYHRIVAATSSGASVETDREKAAEWGLFKSDVCLACLLPCLLLHLIRFMHSALALWLSHNAFLLFIGPPIGGNLQAWKLPVSSGGICHCNLESGTIHLRGCLAGPLTAFLQIHPQHAGKVMRQAEWIKAVGQLAQGGSSHAERDLPFRHDPSLPKECPILDNHKPQLQVRSSWLGCLASSIGAPMPPSTTKRPAGPWIRDSSLRQQRKAVDAGPSNLVNL